MLCGGLALLGLCAGTLTCPPTPCTVLLLGLGYHEHLPLWRLPTITVFIFSWKSTVLARL